MNNKIHEFGHIIAILSLMTIGIVALRAGVDTYIVPLCIIGIGGIAGYKIKALPGKPSNTTTPS